MNITPQVMQRAESHLRSTIVSRLTGANIDGRVVEARRMLLEKRERVAALRQLIAVTEAAIFAGCAAGAGRLDASEYKTCLAAELIYLERMERVVAVFDELFPGKEK